MLVARPHDAKPLQCKVDVDVLEQLRLGSNHCSKAAGGDANRVAAQFGVHPTLIHGWKKQLLAGAETVFASGAKTTGPPEDKTAELFEQIGRLKVELDWVKKKSAALG